MFTEKDIEQIENKGLTDDQILGQVRNFKNGFPFLKLNKPATINDGITVLSVDELEKYVNTFNEIDRSKLKFVPASGAASRMFKALFEFISEGDETRLEQYPAINTFFNEIESFAFYADLKEVLKGGGEELEKLLSSKQYKKVLEALLDDKGLAYGSLPKGVLKFHAEDGIIKTAFEEHLVEGCEYAQSKSGLVKLHFTVSPEHIEKFKTIQDRILNEYQNKYKVDFEIEYSVQKPSTDMVSVDLENNIFRNDDGSMLFRPGGHGALLENLNDLNADIIFIKNIDNVVPDSLKSETIKYKKALGGLLHTIQTRAYSYLYKLDVPGFEDDYELSEIESFIEKDLGLSLSKEYSLLEFHQRKEYLNKILNRPFRICGMVKNEGEPGGGPFWVENDKGESSLQIVESSQINVDDKSQYDIMKGSSHFNPVDLVCGIKNYRGEKFDLLKFRDPATGFISEKSKDGKKLKAQELPGLWNGAMANWVTLFVEVPLITFNPVKTVNDLLRKEHQG